MATLRKFSILCCSPKKSARAVLNCSGTLNSLFFRKYFDSCSLWTKLPMDNKDSNVNIEWDPEGIISTDAKVNNCFACIVLNRKITIPTDVVQRIWTTASLRCAVDGGANRWKDYLIKHNLECQMKTPDFITGDFDSITEETSKYFKDTTIKWVHTPNQDETDFTKSIGVIQPLLEKHEKAQRKFVIAFSDTSGRLDQILANINTLYKMERCNFNIYLLSGTSMTWLLQPGKHSIKIPKELVKNERWCALIPIGTKATNVTTQGLKWNLVNGEMEFGGLVSTSNTYAAELVEIETVTSLVWTMGLFSFEDD